MNFSLRTRLILLNTILFFFVFIITTVIIINGAKQAVVEEIRSTAYLTSKLIEVVVGSGEIGSQAMQERIVNKIHSLGETRHMHIELSTPIQQYHNREVLGKAVLASQLEEVPITSDAPAWFISLVKPEPEIIRKWIYGQNTRPVELLLISDPSDEITEVWNEVRNITGLLILFILLANTLVFFVTGISLKPLKKVTSALTEIEQGDYKIRLPSFKLPELNVISQKFNHMAGVLEESKQKNIELTKRKIDIQEQEQQYLAQELHDEMGQTISAVKAVAISLKHKVAEKNNDKNMIESLTSIITCSDQMYSSARNMMHRLRPVVLDEIGLVPAIQDMVDEWNEQHQDLFCKLTIENLPHSFNKEIDIAIYRIVQEALTNVVKHANAEKVSIDLLYREKLISLNVEDDGEGFEFDSQLKSFGLTGMEERIATLNGIIDFYSSKNNGFSIKIKIPYKSRVS